MKSLPHPAADDLSNLSRDGLHWRPMTIVPLHTYLKTYRKQSGLNHSEIAFLVGGMSGTSYSRHEKAHRLPVLRTALMYEFIFGVTVRELYEGVFHEGRSRVAVRARGLVASLERQPQSPERDRKLNLVRKLAGDPALATNGGNE